MGFTRIFFAQNFSFPRGGFYGRYYSEETKFLEIGYPLCLKFYFWSINIFYASHAQQVRENRIPMMTNCRWPVPSPASLFCLSQSSSAWPQQPMISHLLLHLLPQSLFRPPSPLPPPPPALADGYTETKAGGGGGRELENRNSGIPFFSSPLPCRRPLPLPLSILQMRQADAHSHTGRGGGERQSAYTQHLRTQVDARGAVRNEKKRVRTPHAGNEGPFSFFFSPSEHVIKFLYVIFSRPISQGRPSAEQASFFSSPRSSEIKDDRQIEKRKTAPQFPSFRPPPPIFIVLLPRTAEKQCSLVGERSKN